MPRRWDWNSSRMNARSSGVSTTDSIVVPSARVFPSRAARLRRWTRSFGSAPSGSNARTQWSATSRSTSTPTRRAVSVSDSSITSTASASARRRRERTEFTTSRAASIPTSPASTAAARPGYFPGSSSPVSPTAGAIAEPRPTRILAVACETPVRCCTSSTPSRALFWNARDSSPRDFRERCSSCAATDSRSASASRPSSSTARASARTSSSEPVWNRGATEAAAATAAVRSDAASIPAPNHRGPTSGSRKGASGQGFFRPAEVARFARSERVFDESEE